MYQKMFLRDLFKMFLVFEVEYEREARACNNMLCKKNQLLYCLRRIFQKFMKFVKMPTDRPNDRPTDPIFSAKMTLTEHICEPPKYGEVRCVFLEQGDPEKSNLIFQQST